MRRYLYWFLGGIFALLSILPLVLPNSGTFDDVRRGGTQTTGRIVHKLSETRRAGGMVPGLKSVPITTYSLAYVYTDAMGEEVRSTLDVEKRHYDSVHVGSAVTVAVARVGSSSTMSWLPAFRDMSNSGKTGPGFHLFMWLVAGCFFFRAYIWTLKARDAAEAASPRRMPASAEPAAGPRSPIQRVARTPAVPTAPASRIAKSNSTPAPRGFGRPARL